MNSLWRLSILDELNAVFTSRINTLLDVESHPNDALMCLERAAKDAARGQTLITREMVTRFEDINTQVEAYKAFRNSAIFRLETGSELFKLSEGELKEPSLIRCRDVIIKRAENASQMTALSARAVVEIAENGSWVTGVLDEGHTEKDGHKNRNAHLVHVAWKSLKSSLLSTDV